MQISIKSKVIHSDLSSASEEAMSMLGLHLRPAKTGRALYTGLAASRKAILALPSPDLDFSFRQKLFVCSCLATFRKDQETIEHFQMQFGGTPPSGRSPLRLSEIEECRKWMNKLANQAEDLKGKAKKWEELFQHFQAVRREYLQGISEIPLAHPRKRVEELVKLFEDAATAQPARVLVVKSHLRTSGGLPRFSMAGKALMEEEHILVHEKQVGTAAAILKQIGQEAGNFVEKTEHTLNLADFVKRQRKERGLDVVEARYSEQEASEERLIDFGVPQSILPLRAPVQDEEDAFEMELKN